MGRYREGEDDLFDDEELEATDKRSKKAGAKGLEADIYEAYRGSQDAAKAREDIVEKTKSILALAIDQISDEIMQLAHETIVSVVQEIPDGEERAARSSNYNPAEGPMIDQFAEETDAYMELCEDLGMVSFDSFQTSLTTAFEMYWLTPIEFQIVKDGDDIVRDDEAEWKAQDDLRTSEEAERFLAELKQEWQ